MAGGGGTIVRLLCLPRNGIGIFAIGAGFRSGRLVGKSLSTKRISLARGVGDCIEAVGFADSGTASDACVDSISAQNTAVFAVRFGNPV